MDTVTDRLSAPATQCVSDGQTDWQLAEEQKAGQILYMLHSSFNGSLDCQSTLQHATLPDAREVAADDEGWAGQSI